MMFIQILVDLLAWIVQHWKEVTLFGVVNFVAVAVAKRVGMKQLQRLFGVDKSETSQYVANQARIESKIDYLIERSGGQWPADTLSNTKKNSAPQPKTGSIFSWVGGFLAHFAARKGTSSNTNSNTRRKKLMQKLKSRKFILALATGALVVLNDGLGLNLDSETILAFVGIVATWIVGETVVDAKRASRDNGQDQYH